MDIVDHPTTPVLTARPRLEAPSLVTPVPSLSSGHPYPMGATVAETGTNFAVFSAHATRVELCLFDADGEERRIDLPERSGDIWHGHLEGVREGQLYGYRVHGPYAPMEGHRFNPHKLLIDPHAKQLSGRLVWDDALYGYVRGHHDADLSFDTRDSAPFVPRGVVTAIAARPAAHPRTPWERTIVYEAHVKAMTALMPVDRPGTFEAMASDRVLDHVRDLGVSAVELLPSQAFLDDRFLVEKGLVNHWGYQTLGFFAPEPRYLAGDDPSAFRRMVDRFHARGIEVLMDVVYNHTCEGDETGPTLSFRGLDNRSYYRLPEDRRRSVNDTGTGNTLDLSHPAVMRMVLDSLRYWVETMGVDGFRFDLAPVLGRDATGAFDRNAAFLQAVRADPVLNRVKLIAEPWDIGPGGYQLGGFPPPFAEWNDRFRDRTRRFWRGDAGHARQLAKALTASARQFDHSGRRPTASVNFVTAHDGYTLADLVSYERRHNHANGEGNRDGHGENHSSNLGQEGPTDDPDIRERRVRRRRNLAATLMLAQGTPMWLAGDEIGHSQRGNNNAYAQDNETTWLDWEAMDEGFLAFVKRLIALRRAHPALSQTLFLHGRDRADASGRCTPDLRWWREDGERMGAFDWHDADRHFLAFEVHMAAETPAHVDNDDVVLAAFNAGEARTFHLPEGTWRRVLDTARPDAEETRVSGDVEVSAESVCVFVR